MGFQPAILDLNGTVNPVIILDPGMPPTNIVQEGTPFQVRVDWTITGSGVPFLDDDKFRVQVFAESIGAGYEGPLGATAFVPCGSTPTSPLSLSATIPVAPGALTEGLYEVAVVLTLQNAVGTPLHVVGYAKLDDLLQIYK